MIIYFMIYLHLFCYFINIFYLERDRFNDFEQLLFNILDYCLGKLYIPFAYVHNTVDILLRSTLFSSIYIFLFKLLISIS